ncbi:hypothetical protein KJ059_14255 [Myxococcota bacterium]|nr:hypothetical protein [Myxococcota bacterium]MCZ7617718.1 hypothetical protein [Myxococcota bacterium]
MTSDVRDSAGTRSVTKGLGFDAAQLRARYREEREKRLRADGNEQYIEVKDGFAHFLEDPYVEPGFEREPLTCTPSDTTMRASPVR